MEKNRRKSQDHKSSEMVSQGGSQVGLVTVYSKEDWSKLKKDNYNIIKEQSIANKKKIEE
jgi:hypothetical protein